MQSGGNVRREGNEGKNEQLDAISTAPKSSPSYRSLSMAPDWSRALDIRGLPTAGDTHG